MEKTTRNYMSGQLSSGGAITSGYRLFSTLFRQLLRASWPIAIVYGLAMALMSGYYIQNVIPLMGISQIVDPETMQSLIAKTWLQFGGLAVLFGLSMLCLTSYGFSAMRQHMVSGNAPVEGIAKPVVKKPHWHGSFDVKMLGRVILTMLWMVVVIAIASTVVYVLVKLGQKMELTSLYIGAGVIGFCLLMLMLPFCYTCYKAILREHFSIMAIPFRGYLKGLGHLGIIFVVVFVTAIITLILTLITQLPALILYTASIQSQIGVVQGDEPGMPTNMGWLSMIVFFIAGFIQGYIHLSTLFPLYYVYRGLNQTFDKTEI